MIRGSDQHPGIVWTGANIQAQSTYSDTYKNGALKNELSSPPITPPWNGLLWTIASCYRWLNREKLVQRQPRFTNFFFFLLFTLSLFILPLMRLFGFFFFFFFSHFLSDRLHLFTATATATATVILRPASHRICISHQPQPQLTVPRFQFFLFLYPGFKYGAKEENDPFELCSALPPGVLHRGLPHRIPTPR